MANEHRIYQRNNLGWFVEVDDHVEGPLETHEEAVTFARLLQTAGIARSSETACTENECL